jgi:S-adenosylmethionine hydrolase
MRVVFPNWVRPASSPRRSAFRIGALLILAWIAGLSSCGDRARQEESQKAGAARPRATIVFMTDFGAANDSVAICKAVMLSIVPNARIMDITHQVAPYSIEDGARFLAGVTPYYPAGTVFIAVIDPGVGTSRRAIIVKSGKGQYFVLPDNGLITPVADRDGVEAAREISNPAFMIGSGISSTFHGRDIFSPAAAHLAADEDWTMAGPEVKDLVRLLPRAARLDEKGITGEVIALDDPYGSLITDVTNEDFQKLGYALGERVSIKIDKKAYLIPYVKTFMDVPIGQPLLYVDSRGRIGLALNERNFSQAYKVAPGAAVFIPRKGNRVK